MGVVSKREDDIDRFLESGVSEKDGSPTQSVEYTPTALAEARSRFAEATDARNRLELERRDLIDEFNREDAVLAAGELQEDEQRLSRFLEVTKKLQRTLDREVKLSIELARLKGCLK